MLNTHSITLGHSEIEELKQTLEAIDIDPYSAGFSNTGYKKVHTQYRGITPIFLKEVLRKFFLETDVDILVIKDIPIDVTDSTPVDIFLPEYKKGRLSENILLLLSSELGTPFAIDSENNGNMIHNIYPVREYSETQSSKSSKSFLTAHTELSCLERPPDYLILLGLRESHYEVVTPVIKLDELLSYLDEKEKSLLTKPLFITRIDESMRSEDLRNSTTKKFSIMKHDENGTNLWRYDVEYVEGTDKASKALVAKIRLIHETLFRDVIIAAGEVVIVKNAKVAHGRKPFPALYDGTDRWIQRINVYKGDSECYFKAEDLFSYSDAR